MLPPIAQVAEKFVFPRATTTVAKALAAKQAQTITLTGWIDRKPKQISKSLTFARLRDGSGKIIQLVDTNSPSQLKSLKPDSTISVEGEIEVKSNGVDLKVASLKVLNRANIVPSQLISETKDWPPQYRYIQLRQPNMQEVLKKRAKIVKTCREALDDQEFVEIETPLLFKSTPEGAREFLIPTRKKGLMYALPQSPQQYKQLLIASGVERYYQVAKCFRDEDLRADRQPEFTQLDLEMGFANGSDVQQVIESLVERVWSQHSATKLVTLDEKQALVEATGKLGKLTYQTAIEKYGIDKPDLRSSIEIKQIPAEATTNPEYSVFEAIVLSDWTESSDIFEGLKSDKEYKNRVPTVVIFESEGQIRSIVEPLAKVDNWHDFFDTLGARPGDLVAFSDRRPANYENPTPLGRLRQVAIALIPDCYRRTTESVGCWVHEFPLFEPSSDDTGLYPSYKWDEINSTHHPFTMVKIEDYHKLEADPLSCHGQHYDLVIDGVEVGGGSTRVHDPELQKFIFEHVLKITNSEKLFGHLLQALATGCPPHAGLAIGLDRIVAMLCGLKSLRDVIAFPKTITGADPLIGSPSKVTKDQLKPYHVGVN
ncbi:Aspartate--tRNA ligase, mitochondrial [Wickerhamiella sorbophila]|uniref:Aspartate--tRNA ligase, mitochondrial n=1 Tax=Wickerhamiella sorbophila TaxID=45607 RepID=A0A2T0FMX3_9ASCO|nr:Aspartate--tRNA ligase, mitochondrial [Wickerhamiella sorbophila]PRT56353.1 Aspartate--tRNA ligase, mitochondrial [Wickerhamiella sorbophila]